METILKLSGFGDTVLSYLLPFLFVLTILGNPGEFTIAELAEKIVVMTNSRSRFVHRPLPADDPVRRRPDITLAGKELSWQPQVGLDDGLRETIAYFAKLLAS